MANKKRTTQKLGTLKTLSTEQATLERNATFEEGAHSDHRRAVCYNRACAGYRRERDAAEPCSCRKTSAKPTSSRSRW